MLVVDKPAGPTSHDVVDRVRRALGTRRVGHTGTLDPFATGVLPVCVGKATRLARFLTGGDKAYLASVRLGFATTTDDLTGEPLGEARPVTLSRAAVEEACRRFVGTRDQTPPFYSAKRIAGRKMYELAREGAEIRPAPVSVTFHAIDVTRMEADLVEIAVRCSSGTYIRALGRDLGEALGSGGHLVALRRTESGGFGLAEAVSWDEVDAARGPALAERLLPLSKMLGDLPAVTVGRAGSELLRRGRDLSRAVVLDGFPPDPPPGRLRVVDEDGHLLALAVPRGFGRQPLGLTLEPVLHPDLVLTDPE